MGLIDLDGQCNLTTWLLGGGIEEPDKPDDDEAPPYDAAEELSDEEGEGEGGDEFAGGDDVASNSKEVTLDVMPKGRVWQVI